jgi:hypothetical protein
MKLNTYTYSNNGVTATIINRKQYWELQVKSSERIIIIDSNSIYWNTKKAAKNYAMVILSNY